ncbi:MAG: hypothetical protein KF770_32090 [Anaerolineae bacterium]|nr:hypothetical protein [Anaerolineae bacterium]
MAQAASNPQIRTSTYALSNTGPLISAFQSNSFALLGQLFAEVRVSPVCVEELIKHGWESAIELAKPQLVIVKLTSGEEKKAWGIAAQIAKHPNTNDPVIENHLGEAQVITLALRSEYQDDVLLLDELAARAVAKQQGVQLSGFPGVLLLAVQVGLISPVELKKRLEQCRLQGTHYSHAFIEQVFEMARQVVRRS